MSTLQSPSVEQDTCLSEDAVLAFACGETTESDRQRIHDHVDTCDACRQLIVATAALEGSGGALGIELDSLARLAAAFDSGLRAITFTEGKRLAHRFDVTRFVDRGGMGEVYEAFDSVVGARVALKALVCTTTENDTGTSRLGEEVKLARRIAHPNVCRIHDLHEHRQAEHQPLRFLAMEFVDGVTLKERLLAGELAIEEACSVARQLLLGLGAVHAAGVLHLDFKSQNVMLRHGQAPAQPVVMDFGLSRAFEKELRLRTSERGAAGSIGYMSPEQLECQSTIGPAADVYAFGVVFHEMLTGHMPFEGDSPAAIMLKQLKSRAVPPSRLRPGISPELDEFVLTCLSRHARSRFQSAASAIEALDGCMGPALRKQHRAGPWLRTLGIAVLAAAAAGTLVHRAGRMTSAQTWAPEAVASGARVVAVLPARPLESDSKPMPSTPPPPPREPVAGSVAEPLAGSASAPSRGGPARHQRAVPATKSTALAKSGAAPAPAAAPQGSSAPPGNSLPDRTTRPAEGVRAPEPATRTQPEKAGWSPKSAPDFLL